MGCAKIVRKKTCFYPPLPFLSVWDKLYYHILSLLHIYPENTRTLFPLLRCSLWDLYMLMIGYIMAGWSCSFVCKLHILIIIIMQTYLKTLNCQNAFQVHAAECVSTIKKIISIIFLSIYGAVYFQLTHFSYVDCENVYCILLSSSNRKCE